MIYRRQRRQYIYAIFLAVIAVVNVLFYFILTRPSQKEYSNLQEETAKLQSQIAKSDKYFSQLVKNSGIIDNFDKDKNALVMMHLVQRNKGYSEILSKLDMMVQHSGAKHTRMTLSQNPTPQAGLNALAIVLPLEGNYSSIVSFIRELEKSETFFLITAINVERTTQAGGQTGPGQPAFVNTAASTAPGAVQLSLTLETYFYQ